MIQSLENAPPGACVVSLIIRVDCRIDIPDMLQGTTGKQIESFKEIATSVFRIKSAVLYNDSID